MTTGTHTAGEDPRNAEILVSVNGELVPRAQAVVSVFDSGFVLGDGVWEGLRVIGGGIAFLEAHLDRLYAGAKALDFAIPLTRAEMTRRLFECLAANGMQDGVHIRLMVTRGVRSTPYQDPRITVSPPTVVFVPEYKSPPAGLAESGIRLFTVHQRRTAPDMQDQKLNSHSKLNCILACIQAAEAGADEALMLDPDGAVATCNSTHFFIVRAGEVWTSDGLYCLGGITRGNVIALSRELGVPVREKRFSLVDVYCADEGFVTGTFAGLVPVHEVDGRVIGEPPADGERAGPLTRRLRAAYKALAAASLTRPEAAASA